MSASDEPGVVSTAVELRKLLVGDAVARHRNDRLPLIASSGPSFKKRMRVVYVCRAGRAGTLQYAKKVKSLDRATTQGLPESLSGSFFRIPSPNEKRVCLLLPARLVCCMLPISLGTRSLKYSDPAPPKAACGVRPHPGDCKKQHVPGRVLQNS